MTLWFAPLVDHDRFTPVGLEDRMALLRYQHIRLSICEDGRQTIMRLRRIQGQVCRAKRHHCQHGAEFDGAPWHANRHQRTLCHTCDGQPIRKLIDVDRELVVRQSAIGCDHRTLVSAQLALLRDQVEEISHHTASSVCCGSAS